MESQFNDDMKLAIRLIVSICKGKSEQFDFKNILQDSKIVTLLLQCEKENGIQEYFDKFKIPFAKDVKVGIRCFVINKLVPLASEYELYYTATLAPGTKLHQIISLCPEYVLYEISKKHLPETLDYKIPEGIIEINYDISEDHYDWGSSIAKYIRGNVKNKTVILPESLRSFSPLIFKGMENEINSIVLNDGLEIITDSLEILNLDTLSIPSSLYSFYGNDETLDVRILEFRDYFNSKIFNDEYKFRVLFKHFILKDCIYQEISDKDGVTLGLDKIISLEEIRFVDGDTKHTFRLTKKDLSDIKISISRGILEHYMGIDILCSYIYEKLKEKIDEKRDDYCRVYSMHF